ncbi:hypothetical protein E1301_Tti014311 [Triplophysa tibetana]|uniref:Uncharacterized protein n=1 Tax=Triplophysa tibetana TaxID=1572043 RepID=A0A5A9PH35_9TELE|nr:hypothetical protein E1301_Tti014311 [Triplophysa tibetana]
MCSVTLMEIKTEPTVKEETTSGDENLGGFIPSVKLENVGNLKIKTEPNAEEQTEEDCGNMMKIKTEPEEKTCEDSGHMMDIEPTAEELYTDEDDDDDDDGDCDYSVHPGLVTSALSSDKVSWFNLIPFLRNKGVEIAVTAKSKLIPRRTAVEYRNEPEDGHVKHISMVLLVTILNQLKILNLLVTSGMK